MTLTVLTDFEDIEGSDICSIVLSELVTVAVADAFSFSSDCVAMGSGLAGTGSWAFIGLTSGAGDGEDGLAAGLVVLDLIGLISTPTIRR